MAVKDQSLDIGVGDLFLSRLCGGEEFKRYVTHFFIFLSRLCGGEDDSVCCCAVRSFLSRLCGGEASPF